MSGDISGSFVVVMVEDETVNIQMFENFMKKAYGTERTLASGSVLASSPFKPNPDEPDMHRLQGTIQLPSGDIRPLTVYTMKNGGIYNQYVIKDKTIKPNLVFMDEQIGGSPPALGAGGELIRLSIAAGIDCKFYYNSTTPQALLAEHYCPTPDSEPPESFPFETQEEFDAQILNTYTFNKRTQKFETTKIGTKGKFCRYINAQAALHYACSKTAHTEAKAADDETGDDTSAFGPRRHTIDPSPSGSLLDGDGDEKARAEATLPGSGAPPVVTGRVLSLTSLPSPGGTMTAVPSPLERLATIAVQKQSFSGRCSESPVHVQVEATPPGTPIPRRSESPLSHRPSLASLARSSDLPNQPRRNAVLVLPTATTNVDKPEPHERRSGSSSISYHSPGEQHRQIPRTPRTKRTTTIRRPDKGTKKSYWRCSCLPWGRKKPVTPKLPEPEV